MTREEWRTFVDTLVCVECGRTAERYASMAAPLHFHHRDKREKVANVSSMVYGGRPWSAIATEIEKCDVLCRRCHRAKHPQARRPPVISTNRTRSVEVVGLNGTMIMEVVE